jgi:hypothetical protein
MTNPQVAKLIFNGKVAGFRVRTLNTEGTENLFDIDKDSIPEPMLHALVNYSTEELQLVNKNGILMTAYEAHRDLPIEDISEDKQKLMSILNRITAVSVKKDKYTQSTTILDRGIALFGLNLEVQIVEKVAIDAKYNLDIFSSSTEELKTFLSYVKWDDSFNAILEASEKGRNIYDIDLTSFDIDSLVNNGYKISLIENKTSSIKFTTDVEANYLDEAKSEKLTVLDFSNSEVFLRYRNIENVNITYYKSVSKYIIEYWQELHKKDRLRVYNDELYDTVWEMLDSGNIL